MHDLLNISLQSLSSGANLRPQWLPKSQRKSIRCIRPLCYYIFSILNVTANKSWVIEDILRVLMEPVFTTKSSKVRHQLEVSNISTNKALEVRLIVIWSIFSPGWKFGWYSESTGTGINSLEIWCLESARGCTKLMSQTCRRTWEWKGSWWGLSLCFGNTMVGSAGVGWLVA